jgi:adenylate cyclase
VDSSRNKLTLRAKTISFDDKGQVLIDFGGVPRTIPTYSFSDVIRGQVAPDTFRDKLVFVGLVGDADPTLYATPLTGGAEIEPNVDIQAQIADMWLSNPPHTLEPQDNLALIASILAMSLLAGLTMPHVRPLSAAALALIYALAYLLYSFELFASGVLPNLLLPPLALVLTFMTVVTFRYLTEERPRRALILLFRRYLSNDSADRVVENIDSGELKLVGMQRMVTVLNVELRGLSDLADRESAEVVLSVANKQVGVVSRAITDEGGIVTKPLGDSVVAVWNALLEQSDHIDRALRTASEIRRLVHTQRGQLNDGAAFSIAMAISTGTAIVGRVKTIDQSEFTVLGNAVDNAKDVCAFAGPLQILVDQNTAQNSHTAIELRELSPIRIRGRKEPMAIWEVKRSDLVTMEEESGE